MTVHVPRPMPPGRFRIVSAFPPRCVFGVGVIGVSVFGLSVLGFFVEPAAAERTAVVDPATVRPAAATEFSARLKRRVDGKTSRAQLFVKDRRYRIEHLGGIKTDMGYATVTIVRLDRHVVWYVLSQRRLVLEVPVTPDDVLPLSVTLDGEIARERIGDSIVGDRDAVLYEVVVNRHGHRETYYEWVDAARGLLLKLMSQDRDWSLEYERIVLSGQPDYFFETPLGYRTFRAIDTPPRTIE